MKAWTRLISVLTGIETAIIAGSKDDARTGARLLRTEDRLELLEQLPLQWASYRDEMNRLANRIEKVQQRKEKRENPEPAEPEPVLDSITHQVLERRNRNGLRHSSA